MKLNLNIANLRKDTKDDTELGLILWKIFFLSGNLQIYLNDPEELETTWEAPLIRIRHEIDPSWDKGYNFIFDPEVIPGDINFKNYTSIAMKGQHHRRWRKIFKLINKDNAYSLLELTHKHVIIFQEGDNFQLLIDKELINKSNLAEIEALIDEELSLIDPDEYSYFIGYEGTALDKGNKERRIGAYVCINIEPLYLISNFGKYETHLFQYIEILLNKGYGYRPDYWKEEELKDFWIQYEDKLLNEIRGLSDFPYTFEEVIDSLSGQDNRQLSVVKGRRDYVKSSMYLEAQKFGKILNRDQLELFEENKPTQDQFNRLGLKLSVTELRVIHAIQRMLTETSYQGNWIPERVKTSGWQGIAEVPTVQFSKAKLFEYCNVGKRETGRNKLEYNAHECEEVIKVLNKLAEQSISYYPYNRKKYTRKGVRVDTIKVVEPLYRLMTGYEDLTLEEYDRLVTGKEDLETRGKVKFIRLAPCPLFIDRESDYFVLKEQSFIEDIGKLSGGKTSKFVVTFIEWLIYQSRFTGARNKTGWTIKRKLDTMALQLNMLSYMNKRKWGVIKKELTKCMDIAQRLNYLESFEEIEGKASSIVIFKLNKDKYSLEGGIPEEDQEFNYTELQ